MDRRPERSTLSLILMSVMVISLLLVVIVVSNSGSNPSGRFAHAAALETVASGTCGTEGDGSNLTWTLDSEGTLTISGAGDMHSYATESEGTWRFDAPWIGFQSEITEIIIKSGVTSIGDGSFFHCTNLIKATIPDSVTSIGIWAFAGCTKSTDIAIPDSVTSIGDFSFSDCERLAAIMIPDSVTSLGGHIFQGCSSLVNVTLPDNISRIGEYTFDHCSSLANIVIPNSVISIGECAFGLCTNLTSVSIPSSVTNIDDYAFHNSGLTMVNFGGTAAQWNAATNSATDIFEGITAPVEVHVEQFLGTAQGAGRSLDDPELFESTISFRAPIKPDISNCKGYLKQCVPGIGEDDITVTAEVVDGDLSVLTFSFRSPNEGTFEVDLTPFLLVEEIQTPNSVFVYDVTQTQSPVSVRPPETPNPDPDPTPTPFPSLPPEIPATPSPVPTVTPPPASAPPSYDYSYDYNPAPPPSPKLPAPELVVQPSEPPVSSLQLAVRKEKEIVDWVDRLNLPDYSVGLYETLDQGSTSILNGCLIQDASFTLPASMSGSSGKYKVASVEQVDFELAEMFSSGVSLGISSFTSEDFYIVNAAQSDSQINYGALRMGDVVRTPSFNGVFVTSLLHGQNFDQEKKQACTYISTVFQAFDRDHPEVFWLSGKGRVRIITAGDASGRETAYFFLILADDNGFNMRAPAWNSAGAVTGGIQRRDQAAVKILSTVTASAPAEQVRQLNRWLTQHNEYNTSPDLTAIGNEPHECLAALEGRSGRDGPVCDAYARAFKVLCDRIGIPCVLENGYAKTAPNSKGVLHMWNAVQIGGSWYGVDVTWNDPVPQRSNGAKSGYENEQYLLVGSATKIQSMTFSASHPATNRASVDGVSFINGPALSASAFSGGAGAAGPAPSPTPAPSQPSGSQVLASGQIFYDVPKGRWFYNAVNYAYNHGMMVGTGPRVFSPDGITTRQELWMILARMDGAAPADMRAARSWAVNLRLTDGAGATGYLSRQEFAATLHHYCALKGYNTFSMFSLDRFPDSRSIAGYAQTGMAWAVGHGLLRGTDKGRLEPIGTTTRAEMATILMRFQEDFAK